MKSIYFKTGLLFILFSSCQVSTKRYNVSKAYLAACESGEQPCSPIQIDRQTKDEKLVLDFSINAVGASLGLCDSSYLFQVASFKSPNPLRKGFVSNGSVPSLNLTGLPDGKYYVYIVGEDVGGICDLKINSEDQAAHNIIAFCNSGFGTSAGQNIFIRL